MSSQGIDSGSSGMARLAPYLPRLVADWIRTAPEVRHRKLQGSMAFVDISGFTSLSERLARHGSVGAEELAATINRSFVELLAVAYDNGGGLLKFGGDALLLFFSGDDHQVRACLAAAGMRRKLRSVGKVDVLGHKVRLRMSTGVHSGSFHFFLVGEVHRELIVTGPAASMTVRMESAAEADEILVSPDTAAALSEELVGQAKEGGFLLTAEQAGAVADAGDKATFDVIEDDADGELAGCIPEGIRDALLSSHLQPEHRRVTVAFVHFDGTDAMVESSPEDGVMASLDDLCTAVQRAAARHGVTVLGTDIDRDGGKIILTAGAPTTLGEDELRMLMAVREVVDGAAALPLRVGVNRGFVFSGDIGPHYRRTFTVMGDTVNLAARLMAKARPGEILATPEVVAQTHAEVETTEVAPFTVKGKAQPVAAVQIGHVSSERRRRDTGVALVGRRAELELMEDAVAEARRGAGTIVQLTGEPGVGKSALVEELEKRCADLSLLRTACELYESSTPYFPFWHLLRRVLGIDLDMTEDDAGTILVAVTKRVAPHVLPWLPLVAQIVDAAVPGTPETSQLEERFRRPRAATAALDLLCSVVPGPVLLVVEDVHWMDEASQDIIREAIDRADSLPWVICLTRRPETDGYVAPEHERVLPIALSPLAAADAAELVHQFAGEAPLQAHVVAALAERSGGNPLFLHELVASARSDTAIEELPDNVEALIAARIDQLPLADRNLLRRLAVLGNSFPAQLVKAVVDDGDDGAGALWARLEGFVEPKPNGSVGFTHALIRDSAYSGLPFRTRKELHGQAGHAIMVMAGAALDEQVELLSLHYFHAERFPEAWSFSLRAAVRARAVFANVEAAGFYDRALVAARYLKAVGPGEMSKTYEALGDAHNNGGNYVDAEKAFRSARRFVGGDVVGQARLMLKLARVMGWIDRYSAALRWISRGLRVLEDVPGDLAAQQRAQLLAWYGRFCLEEGRHKKAIEWCTAAVREAESCSEQDALANALKVLDWARMNLGQLEESDNWSRALAIFEHLGDLIGQASVLNLMGIQAYFHGDWDAALANYRQAQAMVRRTGNAVMDAFYMNNIGEVALEQGHLDEAGAMLTEASRIWRAAGYRSGAGSVACLIGRVSCGKGNFDEAFAFFEESLDEAQDVGGNDEALETTARIAEAQLRSGDPDGALATSAKALSQARSLGGVSAQLPLLLRVQGAALARLQRYDEALAVLDESMRAAEAREADYERALTLRVLARVDAVRDRADYPEAADVSVKILDRLGVVWTPELV